MGRVDKLLAPRDAATDEEDGEIDSQPPSDYDSDGSLDADKPVDAEPRHSQEPQIPSVAAVGVGSASVESSAGVESEEDHVSIENLSLADERGRGKQKLIKEPYEVPTSGAFYMHDDRFAGEPPTQPRQSERRNRRGIDENKWKHDKFEELERQIEQGKPVVRGRHMNRRRGRYGGRNGKMNSDGSERRPPEAAPATRVRPAPQVVEERYDPYMEPDVRPNLEDSQVWRKNSEIRGGRKYGNQRSARGNRGRTGGRGYSSRSEL